MKNFITKSNVLVLAFVFSLLLIGGGFFVPKAEASWLSSLAHKVSDQVDDVNDSLSSLPLSPQITPSPIGPILVPTSLPELPSLPVYSYSDSYYDSYYSYRAPTRYVSPYRNYVSPYSYEQPVSNSTVTSQSTTNINNSVNGSYNTTITGSYNNTSNSNNFYRPANSNDYSYDDSQDYNDNLSVTCYGSPSNAQTGDRISWYARVNGGDGDYEYDWSGTDGLNSSSRSPYKTYDDAGSKRATVTVTDGNGDEDTATCYVNINQNSVLAFSSSYQPTYQAPLESAVYLSQVPYTGVADNMKLYFFIGFLALFSAWVAYIVVSYKSA